MRFLVIAMSLGVVLSAFAVPAALAGEENEMKKEGMWKEKEGMCRCPMCRMAEASREEEKAEPEGKGEDGGQEGKMMEQMGMSKGMMDRCRMMMRAQLDPADPAAILAMKDKLGLSGEQVEKIKQTAEAARTQAKGVLTQEQKKKLHEMPREPRCPMDMQEMMMKKMRSKMEKMGKKPEKTGSKQESGHTESHHPEKK